MFDQEVGKMGRAALLRLREFAQRILFSGVEIVRKRAGSSNQMSGRGFNVADSKVAGQRRATNPVTRGPRDEVASRVAGSHTEIACRSSRNQEPRRTVGVRRGRVALGLLRAGEIYWTVVNERLRQKGRAGGARPSCSLGMGTQEKAPSALARVATESVRVARVSRSQRKQ